MPGSCVPSLLGRRKRTTQASLSGTCLPRRYSSAVSCVENGWYFKISGKTYKLMRKNESLPKSVMYGIATYPQELRPPGFVEIANQPQRRLLDAMGNHRGRNDR